MDSLGIEECPKDIQISRDARAKFTPSSPTPILKFLIYGPIFMKLEM